MSHEADTIDAVLAGQVLTAADDARFRTHLRGCAECRARFDRGMEVLRLARGGSTALAPGEAARLTTRAQRLVRPVAGTPLFPWRLAWAGAGALALAGVLALAVLAWPRSPVGVVLVASKGFLVDGQPAEKDAVILAGAVLSTEKDDAAVLLDGPQGRRGLLLRPNTRLRVHARQELSLEHGRVRVESRKGTEPFLVRTDGGRVVQAAPATFVVERREAATMIAVHAGAVTVHGEGYSVEVKDGQETALAADGALTPPRAVTAGALVEDRGDGTVWDAILRFLRQLIDAIARALAAE